MFISEEVKDIVDEMELFPERWRFNQHHLINKLTHDEYLIRHGPFGVDINGKDVLNIFEKWKIWKSFKNLVKFKAAYCTK